MRYKDITDVRLRGRRESFGTRRRIKVNDLIINRMTGEPVPSTEARKAQRPMSDRATRRSRVRWRDEPARRLTARG